MEVTPVITKTVTPPPRDSIEKRLSDPLAAGLVVTKPTRELMLEGAVRIVALQTALAELIMCLDCEAQGVAMHVTKPERIAEARAVLNSLSV